MLADIGTKWFCNIPEEKYFAPLRILYPFIKFFVNAFVDFTWTFFDSSSNSFSTSICFVLFVVTFLSKFFSLLSKSVFFTKSTISALVAKFACFNLAVEFSAVNLLNSWAVLYLAWSGSVIFFSISLILVLKLVFLTKLLVSVVWIALTFLINSLYSGFLTASFFYCTT